MYVHTHVDLHAFVHNFWRLYVHMSNRNFITMYVLVPLNIQIKSGPSHAPSHGCQCCRAATERNSGAWWEPQFARHCVHMCLRWCIRAPHKQNKSLQILMLEWTPSNTKFWLLVVEWLIHSCHGILWMFMVRLRFRRLQILLHFYLFASHGSDVGPWVHGKRRIRTRANFGLVGPDHFFCKLYPQTGI